MMSNILSTYLRQVYKYFQSYLNMAVYSTVTRLDANIVVIANIARNTVRSALHISSQDGVVELLEEEFV